MTAPTKVFRDKMFKISHRFQRVIKLLFFSEILLAASVDTKFTLDWAPECSASSAGWCNCFVYL